LLLENQRKLQITQSLAYIGNYEIDLINYSWKASSSIFEIIRAKINSINNVNDFLNLVEPSYKDKVTEIYKRAFETNEPFTTEYQIIKLDNNEVRWVIDLANFDLDSNGKPIRILGAIQDITDRKIIENNLNKSEVKYRSLIENMDLGILEVDNNELILKAYPKFCQMVGYTELELIGKKATDIFLPKFEVDNFLNSTKARELGLSNAYEIQMYNKKREIIHVIISGTPIFNEKSEVVGSIGIHYNISGRKQIEQELKESQETFEMIFSSSPTPLIITKPENGEIVLANKAAINLLNLSENELVGKLTDTLFIDKNDRLIIKNIIAERGKVKDLEIKIKNQDQEILSCVLSIEVIDFKGKKMYLKSFTDITKLKKIENELTNSFNLLNEQNKRLLNFSYIVSHNLRSHTSNIKSIVGFLGEEDSESERLQLISHLATVSDMLDETLNNLNDVLSIQKNVDLVLQDLKLSFYINKSLALLHEQIVKNEVHFDINIDDDLITKCNAAYLESIIYNLISNAIKYRKPDIKPIVKISAELENGKCIFSISDNGVGIDLKKNGAKLFGMYKTFNGNNDARGIGLFITKNQIEALGGKIEVNSELGVGTTFTITLR
jgi:PAS domain S-box-containing protein